MELANSEAWKQRQLFVVAMFLKKRRLYVVKHLAYMRL